MIISKGNKFLVPIQTTLLSLVVFFILVGCSGGGGDKLKRHDLFTIPLGTLPGELDWFYREGFRMAGTADIQTRDGLVFLSGGDAGKVMVFNSYGDLVTFVYDPARNPGPATLDDGENTKTTSLWSFRTPRSIAAYDGGFLVEDGVEKNRRMENPDTGDIHDRVILRFDRDGAYLGHLGREGFGGSPFPYVSALDVREDGGIVVTSRVLDAWVSYWFDAAGHSVATVRIRKDQLPGRGEGNLAVYSVRPDPVEWTLHIRMDVYPDLIEGDRPEPRLYTLDLTTLLYAEPLVLTYTGGDPEAGLPEVPPEYLGTTLGGSHLMLAPEGPEYYRMTLIDNTGRIVQNRRLEVDPDTVIYRRFRLQNDGLLTGIFFGPQEASVAWWRIDKLIDNDG